MREILRIFLIEAVFMAVSSISSTCPDKNSFLNQLANSKPIPVVIYPSPDSNVLDGISQCDPEWRNFGTCCDPDDLLLYFRQERKFIEQEYDMKVKSVVEMVGSLQKIFENKQKSKFVSFLLGNGSSTLVKDYEKCKNGLLSIRGPALCSVCSGRSELFFNNKKDKLLIDMDTCKKAISACEPAFDAHSSIVNNMGQAIEDSIAVTTDKKFLFIIDLMNSRGNSLKYSPPQHLIEAFQTIKNSSSQKLKDQASMAACSMLVDVVKKPFTRVEGAFAQVIDNINMRDYLFKQKFKTAVFRLKKAFEANMAVLTQQESLKAQLLEEKFNAILASPNRPQNLTKFYHEKYLEKTQITQYFEGLKTEERKRYRERLNEYNITQKDITIFELGLVFSTINIASKFNSIDQSEALSQNRSHLEFIISNAERLKNLVLAEYIKANAESFGFIRISTPASRSLFSSSDVTELLKNSDSQVLLKVDPQFLRQTELDNPLAFVVDRGSEYRPANLTLAFP